MPGLHICMQIVNSHRSCDVFTRTGGTGVGARDNAKIHSRLRAVTPHSLQSRTKQGDIVSPSSAHCGQRQIRIGKAGYNRSSKTISDAVSITAYQSTIKFCHRNIGSCRVSHGAGRFISLDFDMIGKADPGVTPLTPYHAKCNPTQTKHVCK